MKFFIFFAMMIACIFGFANAQCSGKICAVNILTAKKQTFDSDCAMNDANENGGRKFQSKITNNQLQDISFTEYIGLFPGSC